MTRVLVMGASGMLGHEVYRMCAAHMKTYASLRNQPQYYARQTLFDPAHIISGTSVQDFDTIIAAFERARPDVVVNCIGIVKQSAAAKDPVQSITVNALFPHRLAALCAASGARLIHISTDCVFSGRKGSYTEKDIPDPEDLYGRSKLLGEVDHLAHALTLRTSMIGFELGTQFGLLEWFLSNRGGVVKGYSRAVFSGLTTPALADLIRHLIEAHPALSGLYHVSAAPIDKYALLRLCNQAFDAQVEITPVDDLVIDRSLDSRSFQKAAQWQPRSWDDMIGELARLEATHKTNGLKS